MINLKDKFNKLLFYLLKKVLCFNTVLPILSGPLRGMKWIIGDWGYRFWLGRFEMEKTSSLVKSLKTGSVVYDLGAHVGYYTLLASKLVGETGKVYAFEPMERVVKVLKKHIVLNKIVNVKVFKVVVTNKTGYVSFADKAEYYGVGRVKKGGRNIRAIKLDDFVCKKNIYPPTHIKIDVEGEEYKVLLGAVEVLKKYHPMIWLGTHDSAYNIKVHKKCIKILKLLNYYLQPLDNIYLSKATEIYAYYKRGDQ